MGAHMLTLDDVLLVINQLYQIEKKAAAPAGASLERHLRSIRGRLDERGFRWHDPTGERFDESRTDCEASVAGDATGDLVIADVIKPVIRHHGPSGPVIVQKGVVVVTEHKRTPR